MAADLAALQRATAATDPPDAPRYPFDPPPPPFADGALEPWIGAATVRLQREIHLGCARRLNDLLSRLPAHQDISVESLVRSAAEVPESARAAVLDAAAGHGNHQFWWKMLKPGGNGGAGPQGRLREGLERRFGALVEGHVGSGWAYLGVDPLNGDLLAYALPDNGSTMSLGRPGVMIFDLWEHAWCLDRGADRAAHVEAWWRVVDWDALGRRLDAFWDGRTHT